MRERCALVTDDSDLRAFADEPSIEDFEAADEEEQRTGVRAILFRILRVAAVMLVIAALLVYFIVPFNNMFFNVPYRLRWPRPWTHPIPVAPERSENTSLPA